MGDRENIHIQPFFTARGPGAGGGPPPSAGAGGRGAQAGDLVPVPRRKGLWVPVPGSSSEEELETAPEATLSAGFGRGKANRRPCFVSDSCCWSTRAHSLRDNRSR